ncbi:hypothetical protein AVEN_274415-1 [Araneus ventricosus]|uniref:Uncharacterized protein n=1 Tax=Araneus ventricosus TaxID=182803 RepID=A0A4Y2E4E7_ARAVE|nr:hypothetical protein AVEN_274415-1 [Araneus ventricosus]
MEISNTLLSLTELLGIDQRTCLPPFVNKRFQATKLKLQHSHPLCLCVLLIKCIAFHTPVSKARPEGEHASPNLSQDERYVRGAVSSTVHHTFRSCQRYEAGRVNINELKRRGQAHVVTNSAMISAADELIRENCRITAREIAVELSISKGTVHHIIHKKLGYGKVCAECVPKHLSENQKTARMYVSLTQQFLH